MAITGILHVNINCTNFERSRSFYESIGFEPLHLGESVGPALATALGLPDAHCKGGIFRLGASAGACLLDLLEWQQPGPDGRPYARLNHVGAARVCLSSSDIWADYKALTDRGVEFLSEPQLLESPGSSAWIVCFRDPDGTVLELAEFPKSKPWAEG